MMQFIKNIFHFKLTAKLMMIMFLVGMIPLLVTGYANNQHLSEVLEAEEMNRLNSLNVHKKHQIESYFKRIQSQVKLYSEDRSVVSAVQEFTKAFNLLPEENGLTERDIMRYRDKLVAYYSSQFGTEYENINGESINTTGYVPANPASIVSQYRYIADNPNPLGSKDELDAATDGSSYSGIHREFHPQFRRFLQEYDFYDIFLVEPESGNIVYSVFKEIDFGTSLLSGPYSHTNLAHAFKSALRAGKSGGVTQVDYQHYLPSYNGPASFVSSPIYDGSNLVGVVIFQMPVADINEIVQERTGLGESGEAYLVGKDNLMRSQSPFSEENTILATTLATDSTARIFEGESGAMSTLDYRGVEVISSYSPLDIMGVEWGLVSKVDLTETKGVLYKLVREVLLAAVGALVLLMLVAYLFARGVTNPIKNASKVATNISKGDFENKTASSSRDEINDLMNALGTMQDYLGGKNLDLAGQIEAIGKSQAVIEFSMDGTILSANENFLAVTGYELDEIEGQHHRMFVEPEFGNSPKYKKFWEKLNTGEYVTGEFKRIGRDGREIWIQASYNPIMNAENKPFKVVKYATEITKQKLFNADFSGQIDAISKSQAVIEFNMDGTIITANENFLNTMGYSLDEIHGEHHKMFVEPELAQSAEYATFWEKLNNGEFQSGEYKRVTKSGEEVWIQASYNPINDLNDKPFKVVKYATEITKQKLINADFSGQIEAIGKSQAVIEFKMDGTILDANENFLTTVGYSLEEIRGKHHSMFAEPSFAQSVEYKNFWESLNSGEYQSGEFFRLGKGGKEIWIQASYNPIADLNGVPFKVVKYATDITEQKMQSVRNGIIREALENVTANVMIVDTDNQIMYQNETVVELFRDAESDIRRKLPNFDTNSLMGARIDEVFRVSSQQEAILPSLTTPFDVQIALGERSFQVTANPLLIEDDRVGTVLEWTDRTQEIATEMEVQNVVQGALLGDLSKRISMEGKQGFFEALSKGVNQLVGISEGVVEDTSRVLSAMAAGDLNKTIDRDYEGSFGQLKTDANATVHKLTEIVGNIQNSADLVATGASEISQGNTNLSHRTEEQASSLEETASSMEEMTSTVRQNADNAAEANQLALAARTQAEKGGSVVSQAVEAMSEINASSKKISDIIGVIDQIAFQTNLLALNASVEAARAGDQGRGFAVVASEVRNLAGRSAVAAKEIKDLIEDSGRKVDDGSRLVNESGETLEEIVNGVKKVTDIVGEIAAASQEQSAGIEEVNKAITQMDELTQQNAALVEEAAAASESLGEQATDLTQMISFFDINGTKSAGSNVVPITSGTQSQRSATVSSPSISDAYQAPVESNTIPMMQASSGGSDQEWEEF